MLTCLDGSRHALHRRRHRGPNNREHVDDTPRLGDGVEEGRLGGAERAECIGDGQRVVASELAVWGERRGGRG